ncbi:MAG: hypothetical protein NTX14_00445 [Candidatus Nealsonbacteria bacterium]|nr:hypothetical protein [Candidatus Nealsonbacteria bacterium]
MTGNDEVRREYRINEIARDLLVSGLQNFGQPLEEYADAWQKAMDFMGFDCEVSAAIIDYGKSLLITAAGKDEAQANLFIKEVREKFPMGKYELERQMVAKALIKYAKK